MGFNLKERLASALRIVKGDGTKKGNVNLAIAVIGGTFFLFLLGGIYLLILSKVGSSMTPDSAESNAVEAGVTAISDSFDLAGILPIVGIAVAIIAMVGLVARGAMGGRE